MAADGLRVLAVARSSLATQALPDSQRDFALEFLGLVGLADLLRPSVPHAIDECRSAGIKVMMITGDYPATARAIARQAGLDADELVTGEELEHLSEEALARRLRSATVFARIMPAAEAAHRQCAEGERRNRRDDRRRRQRRAVAEGGAHRHCDGRSRHRRRARGVVDRAARRRLRFDRRIGSARPQNLRQHTQSDGLHLRGSRTDRGSGVTAAAVRTADSVRAGAYRVSAARDRSGVFAGLRGGNRRERRDAPVAASARRTAVFGVIDRLGTASRAPSHSVSLPRSSSRRTCAGCRKTRFAR